MKCWSAAIACLVERLARAHRRQPARLLVLGVFVAAFLIEREEAVELHDRAGGAQVEQAAGGLGRRYRPWCARARPIPSGSPPCASRSVRRAWPDRHRGSFGTSFGRRREVGRADRLVGFLRVLRLGLVAARRLRHVALRRNCCSITRARRGDRLAAICHAVGSHIGDEADRLAADVDAFVEALRDAHGVRRREAELAAASCCSVEVVNGGVADGA